MDDPFVQGLRQLKKADPDRAIEVIFKLFKSVGRMDVAEVVAAKQTLDLFRSNSVVDEDGRNILDTMDEALLVRARTLWRTPRDRDLDKALSVPFNEVFGVQIFRRRII